MSSQTISAPRDANRVPALLGTSSTDGSTPVIIYADPITHRLLVSGGVASSITINTTAITGGTSGRILYDNAGTIGEALVSYSAANINMGAADAAAPVAQSISVQNVVAGTSNTAGAAFTIKGSQSTGNAAGGSILFQTSPLGTSGTNQNALVTAFTILPSGQVNTVGDISIGSNILLANYMRGPNTGNRFTIDVAAAQFDFWGTNSVSRISSWTTPVQHTWQLGPIDAAAPVAQTLGAQGVITGTSNTAGVDFTIRSSVGTGTGAGGQILFQTAPAGSTGSTPNAFATALIIGTTFVEPAYTFRSAASFKGRNVNSYLYLDVGAGQCKFSTGNNGTTAGVTFDYATADTLKVKNLANNADGAFTAGTATFSGLTTAAAITQTVAAKFTVASGTNQRAGNAVLVGGTVTVSNTTVTANTIVMLTRKTSGGTIGTAITYTVSAATSFTITSDNVLDTSTFSYLLIEVV